MTEIEKPDGWVHRSGYRLNADGKSIKYEKKEESLLAIIEAIHNEDHDELDYYTVLFDTSQGRPHDTVRAHQVFHRLEDAKEDLNELMREN